MLLLDLSHTPKVSSERLFHFDAGEIERLVV
jgi:hypothetical protein